MGRGPLQEGDGPTGARRASGPTGARCRGSRGPATPRPGLRAPAQPGAGQRPRYVRPGLGVAFSVDRGSACRLQTPKMTGDLMAPHSRC